MTRATRPGARAETEYAVLVSPASNDTPSTASGLFDFSELAEDGAVESAPLRLVADPEPRALVVVLADGLCDAGAVYERLRAEGFEVLLENDLPKTLHRVRTRQVQVVVASFAQQHGSGLALAESLALVSSQTQLLLRVAKPPQPAARRRLDELRNTRLIAQSALLGDLVVAAREAVESAAGFHGSLFGVLLIDMVQMLHLSRRTATLNLSGANTGSLHFLRGEIIHAEVGLTFGLEAFQEIVQWPCGRMELSVLAARLCTIEQPFELMLLDTLRRIDEARAEGNV